MFDTFGKKKKTVGAHLIFDVTTVTELVDLDS